jgi:GNAT superfamily N-acetyltransferase
MMSAETPLVRAGARSDVPAIVGFIRDLAEFERLAAAVVVEEQQLADALFGENPVAEVLVAELDGEPVGFALFFRSFSTFLGRSGLYLEDLYVKPERRGRGIGTLLLTHLAKIAEDRGYGRMEWAVLNWNRAAIDFYERMGAVSLSEWTTYRLTGKALSDAGR